jgi:hypothetical protein
MEDVNMSEESLRAIALELLEIVGNLAEAAINEYDGHIDIDDSLRKLKGEMAEYRRRIDHAK